MTSLTGILDTIAADPVMIALLAIAAVTVYLWVTRRNSGRRENINYTGVNAYKNVPLTATQKTEVIMHCKYAGNFADFDNKPAYKDAPLKEMRQACDEGKKLGDADAAKNSQVTADRCPSKKLCPQPSAAKRFPCLSVDGTRCVGKKDEKKGVALTDAERNTTENTQKQTARDNKSLANQKGNKASVWQGCTYYTATDYGGSKGWQCGKTNPLNTGVNSASGGDFSSIFKYQCTKTDVCKKKVSDEIDRLKKVTTPATGAGKSKEELDRIQAEASKAGQDAARAANEKVEYKCPSGWKDIPENTGSNPQQCYKQYNDCTAGGESSAYCDNERREYRWRDKYVGGIKV